MRHTRIPALIALALTSLQAHASVSTLCQTALTAQTYEHAKLAAHAETDFGLALYNRVKGGADSNVFLSPHSISTALAMTYTGASGETREAMARGLRLSGLGDDVRGTFRDLTAALSCRKKATYELRTANALWGQEGFRFKPAFLASIESHFAGAFRALDFAQATEASRRTINDWVAQQTSGRITDLLAPGAVDPSTRLVLTNAIYYKAPWQNPFSVAETQPMDFHLRGGGTIQVPGLRQEEKFPTAEVDGVRVVELPFSTSQAGASEQSMLVLVPTADGPSLAALEERLSRQRIGRLRSALRARTVDLTLPKFKFTSEFKLKDALTRLGLGIAFDAQRADFSGISEQARLAISDAIHKAYIDVNERGAEAAAATAVVITETSAELPTEPITLRIDRPFLFLIVDRPTDSVLFLGRVAHPGT